MELKGIFITMLCLSFLALQTPCTSLQIQLQNEQAKRVEISPNPPLLPRKLRFTEEHAFKGNVAVAQHSISSTKKKEDVSGKAKQKEQGRRPEWGEEDYFTMDYSHLWMVWQQKLWLLRRRPMQHNLMRMLATMAGEKQYPWDFERHEETLGWKLMKINSTIHGGAKVQHIDLKMEFP
ncbi:hypothetical protein V6N13_017151 [Hibiscus sabdariffa]